jgi:hypothetical protein
MAPAEAGASLACHRMTEAAELRVLARQSRTWMAPAEVLA